MKSLPSSATRLRVLLVLSSNIPMGVVIPPFTAAWTGTGEAEKLLQGLMANVCDSQACALLASYPKC